VHIPDKVLTDMTARQWLSALNERVFFEDCPCAERIRSRTPQAAVVELTVSGGVRDISSHVIDVYRGVA
jgi:hypothetical protein